MRFAHISDCHLGAWSNHPELREMPVLAFEKAIDICIREGLNFILISGDLFDTSLPPIDILKRTVTKLRECSKLGMAIYAIAGSHDFSPTGKTMMSVLEEAGLLVNVAKAEEIDGKIKLRFANDKTGARITGLFGKRGALESSYFENLDKSIEQLGGFKIFMLHSAITEFKPQNLKDMPSIPLSLLPKNFDYYASGHVHEKFYSEEYRIAFPGALFPTDFQELEKYNAGFFIITVRGNIKWLIDQEWKSVKLFDVQLFDINADGKTSKEVENSLLEKINAETLKNKIVLIKIKGTLKTGRPSDIDFRKIFGIIYGKGAKAVKKNISNLKSSEFEEIKIKHSMRIEELEKALIDEHLGQSKFLDKEKERELTFSMMNALEEQADEAETTTAFQERMKENTKKLLGF